MLSKLTGKYEKRIILILYIINIVLTCRGWEMFVKTFMCVIMEDPWGWTNIYIDVVSKNSCKKAFIAYTFLWMKI